MKWTVVFALAAGLWLWGAGPSLETANHAEAKERMTVEEFRSGRMRSNAAPDSSREWTPTG